MTREEAQQRARQLTAEHPDRFTHSWIAREGTAGEWDVVRVNIPAARRDPLKGTTEAKPKPSEPDDPRPAYWKNVGGPYA